MRLQVQRRDAGVSVGIEVPLLVAVAVVLDPSETTFTPGANQSTHDP